MSDLNALEIEIQVCRLNPEISLSSLDSTKKISGNQVRHSYNQKTKVLGINK